MARRVFFSFHHERDNWRIGQVRNSWVTKPDRKAAGFWDAAAWEKIKKRRDLAIERWIDRQFKDTSVTVVLIGAETAIRKWVQYEIKKSVEIGNGLLGVYIHNLKDKDGYTDRKGYNPFDYIKRDWGGEYLSEIYPTYDWVYDKGYENIGDWVEEAAKKAGR